MTPVTGDMRNGNGDAGGGQFGPWHPGIQSPVAGDLLPSCTIFRPENVFTPFAEVRELRSLTGLDYPDLIAFRSERLALHELLVRVSADLSVPDGPKIEDLGINFRRITRDILERGIVPRYAALSARYAEIRQMLSDFIQAELRGNLAPSHASAPRASRWSGRRVVRSPKFSRRCLRAMAVCGGRRKFLRHSPLTWHATITAATKSARSSSPGSTRR
ncbi:MAG: hypothetical protein ACXW2I_07295 [Burkholderiales bacterium]